MSTTAVAGSGTSFAVARISASNTAASSRTIGVIRAIPATPSTSAISKPVTSSVQP